jgi:hypothetical protein
MFMKRSRLPKGNSKKKTRLPYEKTVAKVDDVTVLVKIGKEWVSYGQSGVKGWTYESIWNDTYNHQLSEEEQDRATDWKIVEKMM